MEKKLRKKKKKKIEKRKREKGNITKKVTKNSPQKTVTDVPSPIIFFNSSLEEKEKVNATALPFTHVNYFVM